MDWVSAGRAEHWFLISAAIIRTDFDKLFEAMHGTHSDESPRAGGVLEWLMENAKSNWCFLPEKGFRYSHGAWQQDGGIRFADDRDSTLFKLAWCERCEGIVGQGWCDPKAILKLSPDLSSQLG